MMRNDGNVLFLILIAVALFAMLTFAVTDAENESGNIDDEMGSVYATQIIQYANDMKTAVSRLRMTNGCRDDQISFYVADVDGLEHNIHNTPAPDKCNVFHVNGGGMDYHLPDVWFDGFASDPSNTPNCGPYEPCLTAANTMPGIGTDGNEGSNRELSLSIREINKNICIAINKKLNLSGLNDDDETHEWIPKLVSKDGTRRFLGSFTEHSRHIMQTTDGTATDPLYKRYTGCVEGNSSVGALEGNYYFYHVLIAR